jgi:hypothetical protein
MFTKLVICLLSIVAISWIWLIWEWKNAPYYDEKTNRWYKKQKD